MISSGRYCFGFDLAYCFLPRHPISQFWQFTDAYIKATHEENDGFLERAMALLVSLSALSYASLTIVAGRAAKATAEAR